jgi:hypothetical protein
MREVSLERAKEIITEPIAELGGRSQNLLKFSRLIMEAEVETIDEIQAISKDSHDLVHLSGVHKFKYSPLKADELRYFWGWLWSSNLIKSVKGLRDYIAMVCEASAFQSGRRRRPYGLLYGSDRPFYGSKPWRTPEWLEARKVKKPLFVPLSEFYPYVSTRSTDEHEFLLAVDALVPKGLNNEFRADICQDMIVAILTGETTLENLRDATPKFIKQFMKQMPSKYGHLSLDMPLVQGENFTLGDTIAAEYRFKF